MSVPQNTGLILFVTHVEADDLFLKIWGQVDKNSATCVERMILPLAKQCAQSQGCIGHQIGNLRVNALCLAKFQTDGYYRARIINIRGDGMVVLQFIDYGNVEVLPPNEIHLLENIPGSESLQSFPSVACDFTLMNVLPINGIWENKIVESIKKTLWYNEYKILVANLIVGHHRFIKLCYNNEDFSELLVKKNMALPATLQDMFRYMQPPQLPVYQQPSKPHQITNISPLSPVPNTTSNPVIRCEQTNPLGYHPTVPLCCQAQQKHMIQVAGVQEALVFKSRVLDVGSKHEVYVSFVEDGPQKFSVQVQSTSVILKTLMREINTHAIEPLQEPPLPGAVCLGRYTQDKVLCRAVVMSVMENKCKLYYVDFGHTEVLPYTDIFQLPSHYINPRVLSIRFTLSGVKELNVTEEMKEFFKKIVSGKSLILHVQPPEGPPLVQYGDLYDNGQNVKDILRQTFPTITAALPVMPSTYKEPRKLLTGTEEVVHVSFVECCRKFFVQLESGLKSLETIMNCLVEFCETAPTLNPNQIRMGLPCAAMYDNQWYRAQILHVSAENVRVLYVDYGNEETVTPMSLRFIHDALVRKLEAQAIKCMLNGCELLPATDEVSSQFELLTLEKQLRMRVVDIHSDCIAVDLYDPENMCDIKSRLAQAISSVENSTPPNDNAIMHQLPVSQSEFSSDTSNKWQKRNQTESWRQPQNGIGGQDRVKPKNWKDEYNEEQQHDTKSEKSNFYRPDARPERFNRDDFADNRNTKDKWNNKYEHNESPPFKSGRNYRDGRNRTTGSTSKHNTSGSSDKSWSDKDSDASSRGSGKHGRSNSNYGGYPKRDGASGKPYSNRWNDKENDRGNYRGGKTFDNDPYHGNNKLKDRKGQGHRITHAKLNAVEETGRYNSVQNVNQFRIPPPSITVGSVQTCEVVFGNSPSDFFVQLSSNYDALDSLMKSIASKYENGGELMKSHHISIGVSCIAQYMEDFKWYRAEIKSIEGDRATVQFVDYGNTETVELDQIKRIEKEFLKLPAQAVNCKLFGIRNINPDDNETTMFAERTSGKTLEAEFLFDDSGIYSVLLREIIEGVPSAGFLNQEFCDGVDLLKAKEEAINKRKPVGSGKQLIPADYAPSDAEWTILTYEAGTRKDVIITWFTNPNNFYCQTLDKNDEFRTMMNEIQKMYVGRESVSYALKVGSPVIAIFSDDGALYRAEIVELNKWNGHVVQYIDFGNTATVQTHKIYPVEKKLMQLPKLAIQCSLMDITPKDGANWSTLDTKAIDSCFDAEKLECTFHELKSNKYLISLNNNGNDVADILVKKNLAARISEPVTVADENVMAKPVSQCDVEKVDISLLGGQMFRAKVSNVENTCKFHIQLSTASETDSIINEYMTDRDSKVMQRLSAREMCLGTGCLVYSNGLWRRAVVSNDPRFTGFRIKFIDTGAYNEMLSDCVLALPGDLAVMQNQALECSLLDVPSSSEGTQKLKDSVEGKHVIVYVHHVDNNRLIVKLYDLLGNKISIDEETDEKISPVCPMPIFSSTHKVLVSYADHSASIWLQRNSEYELEGNLVQALQQFYPASGQTLEPKINLLCAAKSTDGQWYRGKIIETKENVAYVNFIDYGNTEEISFDNVMTLDPQFYVPPQLAINVSLSVTLNAAPSDQVEILQTHLSNKELTAVFYNVNNKWIVELLDNGEKMSEKFRSLNLVSEEQTKESQIHNMIVGCKYDVYVSHVDSPSQFWLQRANEADDLAKKQDELQEQALTFPLIDGILEEGSLCITVYSIDNLWYRARVLDADEDITTVRFIDYGNTDVIVNESKTIRQMPDSWKEIKEYALKCRLDVIPIDSEDWNSTTCENFANLVASAESLQVSVIANATPMRVDLFQNDKSISELLVEQEHAVRINKEEDLIDEIVDLELDPHSAFVSHFNSPNEFWVQEEKSVDCLETISDRLLVAEMFQKLEKFDKDALCVAKYSEDGQWYRARIVDHNDQGTEVIFIDYGNSAISVDVCVIPEDLVDLPPLSRKCCLALAEGIKEWSDTACEEFTKLAANGATIFLLHVLKEDETSVVRLTLDGKDVSELLAEFCERHPSTIEERLPPLGEENSPNVFINHVNAPDDFSIQTESSSADLEAMLDRLQLADSFLPLNTFDIGSICAAKYPEDERWYRAKILSHGELGTEVLYIDYGNSARTTELRMLPIDIINMPSLSKHCALQKPDTIEFWTEEACKAFRELAAGGNAMFQMEILDNGEPTLVKLTHNGKNVIDILAPLCGKRIETKNDNFGDETEFETTKVSVSHKEEGTDCNVSESRALDTFDNYSNAINHSQENIENQNQENINIEVQNGNDNYSPDLDAKSILENMIQKIQQSTDKEDEHAKLDELTATNKECLVTSTGLELTVDEIVQTMNRNVTNDTEEEQRVEANDKFETVCENNDVEKVHEIKQDTVSTEVDVECTAKAEVETENVTSIGDKIDCENFKEETEIQTSAISIETEIKMEVAKESMQTNDEVAPEIIEEKKETQTPTIEFETETNTMISMEPTQTNEEVSPEFIEEKKETQAPTTEFETETKTTISIEPTQTNEEVSPEFLEEKTENQVSTINIETDTKIEVVKESTQTNDEVAPEIIEEKRETQMPTIEFETETKTTVAEEPTQKNDEVVPENLEEKKETQMPTIEFETETTTTVAKELTQTNEEVSPEFIEEKIETQVSPINIETETKIKIAKESTQQIDEVAIIAEQTENQIPTMGVEIETETVIAKESTETNDEIVSDEVNNETGNNAPKSEIENKTEIVNDELAIRTSKSSMAISIDRSKIENIASEESNDRLVEIPEINESAKKSISSGPSEADSASNTHESFDATNEKNAENSTKTEDLEIHSAEKDMNLSCPKTVGINLENHLIAKSADAVEIVDTQDVPQKESLSVCEEQSTLSDKVVSRNIKEGNSENDNTESGETRQSSE